MTGTDSDRGLIFRTLSYLFSVTGSNRTAATCNKRYKYSCSFLEIYNEEPRDLLADGDGSEISIKTIDGQVVAQGLTKHAVTNVDQLYQLVKTGSMRRQTSATKMNDRSSRGHSVFTLELESITAPATSPKSGEEPTAAAAAAAESKTVAPPQSGMVERVVSCLHLVDLAGSESAKNSGASKYFIAFSISVAISRAGVN